MNIFLTILIVIGALILLCLVIALFVRRNYQISRDVIINAPQQKVFDYITKLKNQDYYNKWVMVEPEMKKEFKGVDGTAGFIYCWEGKKAGAGEQEIKHISQGTTIITEIRFVKPFPAVAHVTMTAEPVSQNQTKVKWSNESEMKYPMNLMVSLIEKMLAKDMDVSLANLKRILET